MIVYHFNTTRVSEGVYQHQLFLEGEEINFSELDSKFRMAMDYLGSLDARNLERFGEGKLRAKRTITVIESVKDLEALIK